MSSRFLAVLALAVSPLPAAAQTDTGTPAEPVVERVTFDDAVRRALLHNPTVGQAAQAILRAEALLDDARSVFHPALDAFGATTVIDEARGFAGNITQPRRQTAVGATISYPVLAPSRWAERTQAADQVGVARISAEDVRRQVAQAAAEAYLAVLTAQRTVGIAIRTRDTASALAEYARVRLDAGQGSRLNFVRASQELATGEAAVEVARFTLRRSQEALGVAIFAGGPVDAADDPQLAPPSGPFTGDEWLLARPDVRLFSAQVEAADRVVRDTWKERLPSGSLLFAPRYVTPAGFFEPADTWRAAIELRMPIYDRTISASKKLRIAERDTLQLGLDAAKDRARSELRVAREAVAAAVRVVEASHRSAEAAADVLRITEVAYRAGATTNIEVIQAQQTARNTELVAALAEDRLRQARLDLLIAVGQFPEQASVR
jgi:outer membrane protein TolC